MHDAGTTLTPLGMIASDVSKHALLAEVQQLSLHFGYYIVLSLVFIIFRTSNITVLTVTVIPTLMIVEL